MSPVSERVSDASPPEWGDRVVRSLALAALARLQAGQPGVSPRLDQCDAPSLAMSTRTAEERDSQPAQRDELAHSHIVPTCGEVLPPTNVTPPTAITRDTVSLQPSRVRVEPGGSAAWGVVRTFWECKRAWAGAPLGGGQNLTIK